MRQMRMPNDRMGALCRSLFSYWETIRGDRLMPLRDDFEPLDVARLLPFVFLVDVRDEPLDFRYRIIGETIGQFSRQNVMGRWVSEIEHHREPSLIWSLFCSTVRERMPRMAHLSYTDPDISVSRMPVICLPLSNDGETVSKLVGLVDYTDCKKKLENRRSKEWLWHRKSRDRFSQSGEMDPGRQHNPEHYSAIGTGGF